MEGNVKLMRKKEVFCCFVILLAALMVPNMSSADTQTFNLTPGWDYYTDLGSGSVVRTYNPGTGAFDLTVTLSGAKPNTQLQFGFDIFSNTKIDWFGTNNSLGFGVSTREGTTATFSGFSLPSFTTDSNGYFSQTYSLNLSGAQNVPAGTYYLQYILSQPEGGGPVWYRTGSSFGVGFDSLRVSSVPIPSALLLFAPGLAGIAVLRKRFGFMRKG